MAAAKETSKKPRNPKTLNGKVDGIAFTADNQPAAELKKLGWEKWRAKKMLTQEIIKHMTKGDNLQKYIKSLYENAAAGNAKAIETINKGIEDQVEKSEIVHKLGKELADEDYV